MKPKTAVTVLLLAFVAVSVVYLIYKETENVPYADNGADLSLQEQATRENPADRVSVGRKVIVYYFHGDVRCTTCRTIEAYTKEAIHQGFPQEIESGKLEWRVVNVERSENEHFIDDYELSTRTVVLSDLDEEQEMRWMKLERVWQLVKNKEEFLSYIKENTGKYLAGHDG